MNVTWMVYSSLSIIATTTRGSAAEHVLYLKCHRKYYNGSASKNTDLAIFYDTWL